MKEIISIINMPRNFFSKDQPYPVPHREVVRYTSSVHAQAREDVFNLGVNPQTHQRVKSTAIDFILARQNPPGITITVFPGERKDVYLIHRRGISFIDEL